MYNREPTLSGLCGKVLEKTVNIVSHLGLKYPFPSNMKQGIYFFSVLWAFALWYCLNPVFLLGSAIHSFLSVEINSGT